jgi:hypothetical protein
MIAVSPWPIPFVKFVEPNRARRRHTRHQKDTGGSRGNPARRLSGGPRLAAGLPQLTDQRSETARGLDRDRPGFARRARPHLTRPGRRNAGTGAPRAAAAAGVDLAQLRPGAQAAADCDRSDPPAPHAPANRTGRTDPGAIREAGARQRWGSVRQPRSGSARRWGGGPR